MALYVLCTIHLSLDLLSDMNYMAVHGNIWQSKTVYGRIRQCMAINNSKIHFLVVYGSIWQYMALGGKLIA